jgi:hypothetical protein
MMTDGNDDRREQQQMGTTTDGDNNNREQQQTGTTMDGDNNGDGTKTTTVHLAQ